MALFNFNSNREVKLETTYIPTVNSSIVSSDFQNSVWEGELSDIEIGDGFAKQNNQKLDTDPNGRKYVELHSAIAPFFSKQEYIDLEDPEKAKQVHEKKILKIKNQIRQIQGGNGPKFPIDKYDIEVFFDGRYYSAYIYDISTRPEPGKLSQSINVTRPDGIKIGMQDGYEGDIDDDDNAEWIDIRPKDPFEKRLDAPTFTIDLPNGKKYTFTTLINGSRSLIDLRRQEKAIAEFFARLPQSKIQELIDNNVTSITFDAEPDEEFADLYELDKSGECIRICGEDGPEGITAEIISPKFAPPKHNYHTEQFFEREDGYKITIMDDSQASSNITLESPDGKSQQLYVTANTDDFNTDAYHQIMLPKLSKLIDNLPQNVVQDMLNEVDEIKITLGMPTAGVYAKGSNALAVDMFDDDYSVVDTHHISFIHELGHAIDNVGDRYLSQSPEFTAKFEEFQKLAEEYEYETLKNNDTLYNNITFEEYQNGIEDISVRNHALDNAKEFFASAYANSNFEGEDRRGDHIAKLDDIILPLKDSNDPKKKHCYDLYIELKNMVKENVDEVRTKPRNERADNRIKNIVSKISKDIKQDVELLASNFIISLTAYSPELTITNWISRTPEEFNEIIKDFTQVATNENYPEDIKNALKNVINKLQEIRSKVEEIKP